MYVWEPAPRIVVSHVVGVLSLEGAQALELAGRRAIAKHGRYSGFHDWELMTDYESESRNRLTQFGVETLKSTEGIHLLLRSKIVQLGVQAASLVLRNLSTYKDRISFESELKRALSRARGPQA